MMARQVSSDHGPPFPRSKGTLYGAGVRVALGIRVGANVGWRSRVAAGTVSAALVSTIDLARRPQCHKWRSYRMPLTHALRSNCS